MDNPYNKLFDEKIRDHAADFLDEKNNLKRDDSLKIAINEVLHQKNLKKISIDDNFWLQEFRELVALDMTFLQDLSREQLLKAIEAASYQKAKTDTSFKPIEASRYNAESQDTYYMHDDCCFPLYYQHHRTTFFGGHHGGSHCFGGNHGSGNLDCGQDPKAAVICCAIGTIVALVFATCTASYIGTQSMNEAKDSQRGYAIKWLVTLSTLALFMFIMYQTGAVDGAASLITNGLEKRLSESASETWGQVLAWLAVAITPGVLISSFCCCYLGGITIDEDEIRKQKADEIASEYKIDETTMNKIQDSNLMNYIRDADRKGCEYLAATLLTVQAKHLSEKRKMQASIDIHHDTRVAAFEVSSP